LHDKPQTQRSFTSLKEAKQTTHTQSALDNFIMKTTPSRMDIEDH